MERASPADVAIAFLQVPLLIAAGFLLSLIIHFISNYFEDQEEQISPGDLVGFAFAGNIGLTVFWLLVLWPLCADRSFLPDLKAEVPESLSASMVYAFVVAWQIVGTWLALVAICGCIQFSVRTVVRITRQAVRKLSN